MTGERLNALVVIFNMLITHEILGVVTQEELDKAIEMKAIIQKYFQN